jgi:hypothetical protein
MTALLPLSNSREANELEAELKQITIDLYTTYLKDTADQMNVYGAPYLGSLDTIQRFVQRDGLSLINTGSETAQRYVFKAWRYRNPERGLHFARLFLSTLYPNQFEIGQLYQLKTGTYPQNVYTATELATYGYDKAKYYRTSRVRVDISIGDSVPKSIKTVLRTTMAARLLVDMRVAGFTSEEYGGTIYAQGAQICRTAGTALMPTPYAAEKFGYTMRSGASNVAYVAGR